MTVWSGNSEVIVKASKYFREDLERRITRGAKQGVSRELIRQRRCAEYSEEKF